MSTTTKVHAMLVLGQERQAKEYLEQAIRDAGGNLSEVARHEGFSRETLYVYLRRLGIQHEKGAG